MRRQHGAHQRPRPGNRREVDAEEHQPAGGLVVDVVAQAVRRREAAVVEHRDPRRQKRSVEPIGHKKGGQGGDYQPKGVHGR